METPDVNVEKKKDSHLIKNILIIIIFLALGIGCGIFGTLRYLEYKEQQDVIPTVDETEEGPKDITKDENSKELINSLHSMVNSNPMFYTTKGVAVTTMDNTSKLRLVYDYLVANNIGTNETISSLFVGSMNCANDFITDAGVNTSVSTNVCTVTRITKKEFMEANKKLFNDEILDISVTFSPGNGRSCAVDQESYICGTVTDNSGITGSLESKFVIEKVTKDEDGTIAIYDSGYLVDKRSNVDNPNDQYDNYYLHSSDSTEYYYELKSADNLIFKHTFKTEDQKTYYYVSTELVKE